ncbi:hypothetical protein JTE90_009857 [Oedothorax gibbosus]|uniref:Reverse transcriptase domain-containing protein n=1 Tax=Oedothorax gibbosus TaxID=931172 RepID=A0AAV6TN29_9ARAC|nr:hypothetical protein JTE90_009857 [Oedothorax gibbosus]
MVVDYSQTINKYTLLDGYPLPRIDDLINKVSQYKVFSTVDLASAYHQVPILDSDKPYTAFEAAGELGGCESSELLKEDVAEASFSAIESDSSVQSGN